MTSSFRHDDAGQKAVRDAVLGPGLYGPFSLDGRYVFIDKGRAGEEAIRRRLQAWIGRLP